MVVNDYQHKACAVVAILQHQLSGYKTNTDVHATLLEHILKLLLNLILPDHLQECKELYKEKLSMLKDMAKNNLTIRHGEMEA
jgi:hypothetical protein